MRTDEDFLASFEAGDLAPEAFTHSEHVRTVWLLLQRHTLSESLARFSAGLRRFAAKLGKPNLYHETITCAYVFLIQERRMRQASDSWDAFSAENRDLLAWPNGVLNDYYSKETLQSEMARKAFVFPDKLAAISGRG